MATVLEYTLEIVNKVQNELVPAGEVLVLPVSYSQDYPLAVDVTRFQIRTLVATPQVSSNITYLRTAITLQFAHRLSNGFTEETYTFLPVGASMMDQMQQVAPFGFWRTPSAYEIESVEVSEAERVGNVLTWEVLAISLLKP